MKRYLLGLMGVILMVATSAQVCTPSWVGTGSGIQPDTTTNLPHGVVNQPYDAVVQFKVPVYDSLLSLAVDHIELLGVNGLSSIPNSVPFNYNCNPVTCIFHADSTGCVRIQGTATAVGTYALIIAAKVVHVGGIFVNYNVTGYRIVIDQYGAVTSPVSTTHFDVSQNMPNPAHTSTDIVVNLLKGNSYELKISNLVGNVVFRRTYYGKSGMNSITFDASDLQPGVYFYTVNDGAHSITKRMVIDKK